MGRRSWLKAALGLYRFHSFVRRRRNKPAGDKEKIGLKKVQFGIFDHVDRNDRVLAQQLDERIRYVAACEELGFYCYHVAEHHAAPINMVPVPGLFLAAAARATKRIR